MYKTWKNIQLTFFVEFKNLNRLDNHLQHERNKIEVQWVWLYEVLKRIGRFVVKLKVIKYKEDFFYYLSSYLDLDF